VKFFLDADSPLHTCKEENCAGCDVGRNISCHFNSSQLIRFIAFGIVIFIAGGIGMFLFSPWVLLAWGVFIFSFFRLIEIRVMCSHCPHYAEPELKSLKCWANYGSPKLWKYQPGSMTNTEKAVFFAGLAIIFLSPIFFMILSNDLLMLAVYGVLLIAGAYSMTQFLCRQCMNFACPLNRVDRKVRERFFMHNPVVQDAWKEK
jgi:hypothetical protein